MNPHVRKALEIQRDFLRHQVNSSRANIEHDEERLTNQRDHLKEQSEELAAIEAALEAEAVAATSVGDPPQQVIDAYNAGRFA